MEKILASPPATFIIIFLLIWSLARLCRALSFRAKSQAAGTTTPYACGEATYNPLAHPDYSNFFQFAFFFTIAHVATLMISTAPAQSAETMVVALIYVQGVIVGLSVLLRK